MTTGNTWKARRTRETRRTEYGAMTSRETMSTWKARRTRQEVRQRRSIQV